MSRRDDLQRAHELRRASDELMARHTAREMRVNIAARDLYQEALALRERWDLCSGLDSGVGYALDEATP